MTEVETTFDRECASRKITLSRETRSLCLSIIKAVLIELESAPTPIDGIPTIPGRTLTPEEVAELEAALRAQRGTPTRAPVIERAESSEDVRDYHKRYSPHRDL